MIRLILLIAILISPTILIAQEEDSITRLDRKAIEKIIEGIKPTIDAQQEEIKKQWLESPQEKQTECSIRRHKCIKMAEKGGHINPIAETSRIYFCQVSKEICGAHWK